MSAPAPERATVTGSATLRDPRPEPPALASGGAGGSAGKEKGAPPSPRRSPRRSVTTSHSARALRRVYRRTFPAPRSDNAPANAGNARLATNALASEVVDA